MNTKTQDLLKKKTSEKDYKKIAQLKNAALESFINEFIELSSPDTVFVSDGSERDLVEIRKKAIERKEEKVLAIEGHTIHFDG